MHETENLTKDKLKINDEHGNSGRRWDMMTDHIATFHANRPISHR